MSRAQDLHDKIKGLAEEYRGAPGLAYPLIALEGILGHCLAAARKEAEAPSKAAAAEQSAVAELIAEDDAYVPVITPVAPAPAPPAKPAPAVQVAKPKASV